MIARQSLLIQLPTLQSSETMNLTERAQLSYLTYRIIQILHSETYITQQPRNVRKLRRLNNGKLQKSTFVAGRMRISQPIVMRLQAIMIFYVKLLNAAYMNRHCTKFLTFLNSSRVLVYDPRPYFIVQMFLIQQTYS